MRQIKSSVKLSLCSICVGIGVACTFSIASVFLWALLVNGENVGEGSSAIVLVIIHFASSLLGCLIAERLSTTNKLLACAITCLGYYIALVASACLFFDGISTSVWVGLVSVLLAFLLSFLLIVKERPLRRSTKNKKIRHLFV